MTNDDVVSEFTALVTEMHARIDALGDGPVKTRAQRLAAVAHGALEALQDHLAQSGFVQPFSGGDPKPPPPPAS